MYQKVILNKLRLLFTIVLLLLFTSCSSQKKPPKVKRANYKEGMIRTCKIELDSVYQWKVNDLEPQVYEKSLFQYKLSDYIPIAIVKKQFHIKNGVIYDVKNKLGDIDILLQYNQRKRWLIKVKDGVIQESYCQESFNQWQYQFFSYNGNLKMAGFIVADFYIKKYKNGTGYWKDFFQTDYAKVKTKKDLILKEEGKIKNNYKIGKWKYYNKDGTVARETSYTLQDSVDVRFPHCIFNKNEPCY